MNVCTIANCGKPLLARGFCSAHYTQWRKYGDPEHRQIARRGEPVAWLREHVGHAGDECLPWPFRARTVKGYGQVVVEGKLTGAHRAMCALAHGKPPTPKHEAAHSCGNGRKACTNPRHLRWALPTENAEDKRAHGTDSTGERNGQARLHATDIPEIRRLVASGLRHAVIARDFGISRRNVSMIADRKTWAHVE